MCTVVALVRTGHAWPVMLAANRDERVDRAWRAPAAHWADRPGVVAGQDVLGGGTWLGVNAAGVVAAVLNRTGSLGPAPGKRSRGDLPLIALGHTTADAAADAIGTLDLSSYRSFNLVLADRRGATAICSEGHGQARFLRLAAGVHMVTAHDPDDLASARVARHLPRFEGATPPDQDGWAAWTRLLADSDGPAGAALNVPARHGFGTVCATLVAIPASPADSISMSFAPAPPGRASFTAVPAPARGHPAARLL